MRRASFTHQQGNVLRREGARLQAEAWLVAEHVWRNGQAFAEQTGGHPDDAPDAPLPEGLVRVRCIYCTRTDSHSHEVAQTVHVSGLTRRQRRAFVAAMPRSIRLRIRRGDKLSFGANAQEEEAA